MKGRGLSKQSPLVLVVDDDADQRYVESLCLRFAGFEVSEAESGDVALTKVFTEHPDVVLIDFKLPDITGIDVIRLIKSDERTRDIRIVVLTGWTGRQVLEQAKQLACDAVLIKPCAPDILVREIRRVSPVIVGTSRSALDEEAVEIPSPRPARACQ